MPKSARHFHQGLLEELQAFERLDRLGTNDRRVADARGRLERAWNDATQRAVDQARELSAAGNFVGALAVVTDFQPEHGFVDAAREDVEATWAVEGEAVSRRALEMAASGNHDGAIALLESADPPHGSVLATLDDLRANPMCPAELPALVTALNSFTLVASAVVPPGMARACDGSFKVEIQNELVRFGAGCERASATAFVPVLCEGSAEWTDPFVLSFVLRKSGSDWQIFEAVELPPDSQSSR